MSEFGLHTGFLNETNEQKPLFGFLQAAHRCRYKLKTILYHTKQSKGSFQSNNSNFVDMVPRAKELRHLYPLVIRILLTGTHPFWQVVRPILSNRNMHRQTQMIAELLFVHNHLDDIGT